MKRTIAVAVIVMACASAAAKPSANDIAAAKAANIRGLRLQQKKQYKAAIAEYQQAIKLNPTYVLAHYNLASAAALAEDVDLALHELAWVGNRAAWDDVARSAVMKEFGDPDFKNFGKLFDPPSQLITWFGPPGEVLQTQSLLATSADAHVDVGHLLSDTERPRAGAPLANASGAHASECDATDAKQGRVFAVSPSTGKLSGDTAMVSLRDGAALVDGSGKLITRTEPIGCTTPNASQDQIASFAYLAADRPDMASHDPAPAVPTDFFIVQYGQGGRADWTDNVAVFALRGQQLVRVFDATTASSTATGTASLVMTVLDDLVFVPPGQTTKLVFRWDAAAFKFLPLKE